MAPDSMVGKVDFFPMIMNRISMVAQPDYIPSSIVPDEVYLTDWPQFDTLPEDKRAEVMERIPVEGEAEMLEAVKKSDD